MEREGGFVKGLVMHLVDIKGKKCDCPCKEKVAHSLKGAILPNLTFSSQGQVYLQLLFFL